MRISDWSSDVCSSDLAGRRPLPGRCATTRRAGARGLRRAPPDAARGASGTARADSRAAGRALPPAPGARANAADAGAGAACAASHRLRLRSEEHTSELQSLMRISYAVFCLKKKIIKTHDVKMISR